MKIAFLGLGTMGFPMAGHLKTKGHDVRVFNRTESKSKAWVERYGGEMRDTPKDAAEDAEIVMMCLGNDPDIRDVSYGSYGIVSGLRKGAIVVDHSTASAELARELNETFRFNQARFLDAPVSGGQSGAENGNLTVMVGGEETTFADAEAAIGCFAKKVRLMGPAGHGQLTKMMNQICIAGLLQGLSEAIHFAEKAGVDVGKALEATSQGAAQSWQMENRGETMHRRRFDFGFALDWMRKDLGICLKTAERTGAELPVTALVDQFYKRLQTMGKGRQDSSSLIELLDVR